MNIGASTLRRERGARKKEESRRHRVSHQIGDQWVALMVGCLVLAQVSSLMATNYFSSEGDRPSADESHIDTSSVWVWFLFLAVIGVNLLLMIPYLVALSASGSRGFMTTGTHRGVSRYQKTHKDLYDRVNIAKSK